MMSDINDVGTGLIYEFVSGLIDELDGRRVYKKINFSSTPIFGPGGSADGLLSRVAFKFKNS